MTLENSESEFTARFAEYAAQGTLYPQREGSPLMEFSAGGRVLYLFDRNGPYAAKAGPAHVIVHGVLEPEALTLLSGPQQEKLALVGVSALEGQGQVLAISRQFCVVQARIPLVLASFTPLPQCRPEDWVSFRTTAPLHGFVLG